MDQPTVEQIVADLEQKQLMESQVFARRAALDDLLAWGSSWLKTAQNWRLQSFEGKWHGYQRDADSIYDPTLKAAKSSWQSKAFIPLIPSHRETIQAELYKMIVGARPILSMRSRFDQSASINQADNISDLILREFEKSRFEVGYNGILEDRTTYGSGFCRIRFEIEIDERPVRVPIYGPVSPMEAGMAAQLGSMPARVIGYQTVPQDVEIYRGIRFEPLSIWDVFPDPKALQIKRNPIAYRFHYTYGEIIKGVQDGYFFPEAAQALRDVDMESQTPQEKTVIEGDRSIADLRIERTSYGRRLECFEFFARIPKKWVYVRGEPIDDPEKLVPARVIFVPGRCVLTVEFNDSYNGEAPIYKDDYMPVGGQFYGRGIPEQLKDLQNVLNESVNQRLDANSIRLKTKFAVIEKAIRFPNDLDWQSSAAIRLDGKVVQDVRQAIQQVETKHLDNMSIIDPQEMERYAQERTSANKVTLGTAGQTRDTNDTATGQQILLNQAIGKFAYIAMLSEFTFIYEVFRAYWSQIYQNISPQDVLDALGPERAATFQLLTPERIEKEYIYQPQGIFEMQNKGQLQARLQAVVQQFATLPFFDIEAAFDKIVKANNIEPDELKLNPEEVYQKLMAEGMMQMPQSPRRPPPGFPPPNKEPGISGVGSPAQ